MGTFRARIARRRIAEHRELLAEMEGLVETLLDRESLLDIRHLRHFLRNQVRAHVCSDIGQIHPDIARLLAARSAADEMLRADLDDINRYVDRIEETIFSLEQQKDKEHEVVLHVRLRNLVLRLESALQLHVETEERVYLPIVQTEGGCHAPSHLVRHDLDPVT